MNKKTTPDPGIFVTKGMKISIPPFSITLGKDGKSSSTGITLNTGIDMCPYWLKIAYGHLLNTEAANIELMLAKAEHSDEKISQALQNEFTSGMQAIMAASIAIDSYYASVKDHIKIQNNLIQQWRTNRTARYKQIVEVLRRGYSLKKGPTKVLRDIIKEIYIYRDKAVHPEYGTAIPKLHIELNKVTDWRFVTFRFYNAKAIVGQSFSIIYQTSSITLDDSQKELKKYYDELIIELQPIMEKWVEKYGKLF